MRILPHLFLFTIAELLYVGLGQEMNDTDITSQQHEVDSNAPEVSTVTLPKTNDTNGNSSDLNDSNHDELMDWINSIDLRQDGEYPDTTEPSMVTEVESNNMESTTIKTIEDPESFFKWLDSIHPKNSASSATPSPLQGTTSPSTVEHKSNTPPEKVVQEDTKMVETFGKENDVQPYPTESPETIFAPEEHILSEVDSFFNWLDSIKVAKTTPKPNQDGLDLFIGLFSNSKPTSTPDAKNPSNLFQKAKITQPGPLTSTPMSEGDMNDLLSMSDESVDKFSESHPANKAAITGETGNKERKPVIKEIEIISTRKLLIVIGTVAGTLVVFALVISVTYCYRRQNRTKTMPDDTESCDTLEHEKHVPTVNVITADDYPGVFMGIPTNNGIWKELQNLPETSPSVMAESTKI